MFGPKMVFGVAEADWANMSPSHPSILQGAPNKENETRGRKQRSCISFPHLRGVTPETLQVSHGNSPPEKGERKGWGHPESGTGDCPSAHWAGRVSEAALTPWFLEGRFQGALSVRTADGGLWGKLPLRRVTVPAYVHFPSDFFSFFVG